MKKRSHSPLQPQVQKLLASEPLLRVGGGGGLGRAKFSMSIFSCSEGIRIGSSVFGLWHRGLPFIRRQRQFCLYLSLAATWWKLDQRHGIRFGCMQSCCAANKVAQANRPKASSYRRFDATNSTSTVYLRVDRQFIRAGHTPGTFFFTAISTSPQPRPREPGPYKCCLVVFSQRVSVPRARFVPTVGG